MREIELDGFRFDPETAEGQERLARAHAARQRPICGCTEARPELYIAHLGDRYLVKRMPQTGPDHALHCPAFEAPEGISGLGPLVGTAVSWSEDGEVALKLDFPLTINGKRAIAPPPRSADKAAEATTPARRLSITALLHFLWQEAELNRWSPGMAGKRSWGLVRHLILAAAAGKAAKGRPLAEAVFLPEPFQSERKAELAARREALLARLRSAPGTPQPVGLLLAEYKSHEPGRIGARFLFRHLPDLPFHAEADLASRFERAFEAELQMADLVPGLKLVALASFAFARHGAPNLIEIALMPVSEHWIPVETLRELSLVDALAGGRRRFLKPLRFNLARSARLPAALLTDAGPAPYRLYLAGQQGTGSSQDDETTTEEDTNAPDADPAERWPCWTWCEGEAMPALPPALPWKPRD
jgi:hypothetical protein